MYPLRGILKCFFSKKTGFYFITLVIAMFSEGYGYFPDSTFLNCADSIFNLQTDTQITVLRKMRVIRTRALKIKKEKHTYFMVTTCKTINQPFSVVVNTLQHTESYPELFTFISRAVNVEAEKSGEPVTMFIGAYGIYRIYFFGKIRHEYSTDSTRCRILFGNVEQKKYRKAWRKRVRGMIKIGSHDVDIFWTVQKRGESSTRIALTASQAFTTRIPNWMISIGTNRIFRGMVIDLEKYLSTITVPQAPIIPQTAPSVNPPSEEPTSADTLSVESAPQQTTDPHASKPEDPPPAK